MKVLKNVVLQGVHGRSFLLDVFFEESDLPKPTVIFSHGFKGFKDWGHFNQVAEMFAQAGFVFIKFNFAFNGTTIEHPDSFADLEAFGNNNLTKELDDLGTVIDFALNDPRVAPLVDPQRLLLLGHSRGGGISILKAAEDERVKGLATWASVGEFGKFWDDDQLRAWQESGEVVVENSRTRQRMPIFYQYYENYTNHRNRLNVGNAVATLHKPMLAIHGDMDRVVLPKALSYFVQHNPAVETLLIEGGDHTFGIKHPYSGQLTIEAKRVLDASMQFLGKL